MVRFLREIHEKPSSFVVSSSKWPESSAGRPRIGWGSEICARFFRDFQTGGFPPRSRRRPQVLTQLRKDNEYNDFLGRFYHFPEKYLGQFKNLPIEFVYYEGPEYGQGVYFGYGKITNPPTKDKREDGHYFEIGRAHV